MVRAKFKVILIEQPQGADTFRVQLQPVINGSEENKSFFKYTPGGEVNLYVVSEETAKLFDIGAEYYVDFTPANG